MDSRMEKKKDTQNVLELSQMMEKQSIGEKGKSLKNNKMPTDVERQNQSMLQTIRHTSSKIEDITETWKALIANPLNTDKKFIENCIGYGEKEQIVEALYSTFSHVREIQDYLSQQNVHYQPAVKSKCNNTDKKSHNFIDRDIFSSDSESEKEEKVSSEVQCDFSMEDEENKTLEKLDMSEASRVTLEDNESTTGCLNDEATGTGLDNMANETIYEDCEEEPHMENVDESVDDDDSDDSSDEEAGSGECSDTESEDDPSWVVSDADSSGSECEEGKRMTVKDMPQVNFATTNPVQLGKWLSETGPVHLNTMCHCKGACVRNCACRAAGISCGVRCGCKIDKCKWRRAHEVELEEDMYTDEEYKEKLRTKKILQEISENTPATPYKNCLANKIGPMSCTPAPLAKPVFSTPALITKPSKTNPEYSFPSSPTKSVFCTPAPIAKPSMMTLVDTPSNEVFSTPAYRPPSNLTDSAFMTTTAKKRNMKKLFTESFGPQEL